MEINKINSKKSIDFFVLYLKFPSKKYSIRNFKIFLFSNIVKEEICDKVNILFYRVLLFTDNNVFKYIRLSFFVIFLDTLESILISKNKSICFSKI